MNYVLIFIGAAVVNNFVLTYFLGICPFLGVSGDLRKASGMGFAVTFVMLIAAVASAICNGLTRRFSGEVSTVATGIRNCGALKKPKVL